MERGLIMFFHSLIISVILYVFMVYILGQRPLVAENRSILIGAFVLVYMIVYGHGLPKNINRNLF